MTKNSHDLKSISLHVTAINISQDQADLNTMKAGRDGPRHDDIFRIELAGTGAGAGAAWPVAAG